MDTPTKKKNSKSPIWSLEKIVIGHPRKKPKKLCYKDWAGPTNWSKKLKQGPSVAPCSRAFSGKKKLQIKASKETRSRPHSALTLPDSGLWNPPSLVTPSLQQPLPLLPADSFGQQARLRRRHRIDWRPSPCLLCVSSSSTGPQLHASTAALGVCVCHSAVWRSTAHQPDGHCSKLATRLPQTHCRVSPLTRLSSLLCPVPSLCQGPRLGFKHFY